MIRLERLLNENVACFLFVFWCKAVSNGIGEDEVLSVGFYWLIWMTYRRD